MTQGQIRIIGGEWRGRKLKVPALPDLRPTPDRVRETVFNWLQPVIVGARCLDLFTGSGALGFEALSRGAAFVEMIDQSREVVTLLRQELQTLGGANALIHVAKVPQQLQTPSKPFDIIFLDPPFNEDLLLPCCHALEEKKMLASNAYIYLEFKAPIDASHLPVNWALLKSKIAGHVAYHLAQRKD